MGNGVMRGSGSLMAMETCIVMLIFIFCMRSFDKRLRSHFVRMNIALLVAIIAFSVDEWLASFAYPVAYRYITKILKVTAEGYVELVGLYTLDSHASKQKKLIYALPFAITCIIDFLAPFSKLVFYFTDDNKFVPGPLSVAVYIQAAIYSVLILNSFISRKRSNKREIWIILSLLVMVFIGIILEELGYFYNSILSSISVTVMIMYMYKYAERYNVDSVTSCFKRRCFYSDGEKNYRHSMAIVSMDLNNLKEINDNYGHKAGDIALQTFADTCKKAISKKFVLYRTGGDEFMLLGIKASYEEAKEVVETIKERLSDTPYTSSYGIAMYNYGDDFDEIVIKADQAMYDDKREYRISHTKRELSRKEYIESKSLEADEKIKITE